MTPTHLLDRSEPAPPPTPTEPAPISVRMPIDIRSIALTILAVFAGIFMLKNAKAVMIPIVLSVLISYALDPIVTLLQRLRVPRPLASAMVLLALVGAVGGVAYGVRAQVNSLIDQLPQAARRVRQSFERDRPNAGAIQQVQQAAAELEKAANAASVPTPPPSGVARVQVETTSFDVGGYLVSGSKSLIAAAGQLILILFLSFFLLASGDLYRRKLVKIAGPSLGKKKITLHILDEIDRQIERFLLVEAFTSLVVGLATWLVFQAIGLNQAAVWGIAAGVFNTVPYLGPVIVTGATGTAAFLQFGSFHMAALVGLVALLITSLEGLLLTPWLTGRAARMNAAAIFIGVLFWSWIWNVWGMLLAVPMLMVIKAICDHVEDFKAVGELLGE